MKKQPTIKPLSWTPVRRGARYCSPACGRGCTRAEHRRATRRAVNLARRLGPAWRGVVVENLGWHHYAVAGPLRVVPHRDGRFVCFGPEAESEATTPREAVQQVIAAMDRDVAQRLADLRAAQRAIDVAPSSD